MLRLLALFFLYALCFALLRGLASPTIGIDEARELVFTQSLELGYLPDQPPLYPWLLYLTSQLTGPSLLATLALKYLLLGLTIALYYLAAKPLLPDRLWATGCAVSLLLLYQIGWNVHEGVTHTLVLMVAISGTLASFVRLPAGAMIHYLWLGVFLAIGLLSKYGYIGFFGLMMIACMSVREFRNTLHLRGLLLTLVIALSLAAPFYIWLMFQPVEYVYQTHLQTEDADRLGLLLRLPFFAVGFLLPFLLVVVVLAPKVFGSFFSHHQQTFARVLRRFLLLGLCLLALLLAMGTATTLKERWLHPLLLPVPLYVFTLWAGCTAAFPLRRFAIALLLWVGLAAAGRAAVLLIADEPWCGRCRENESYEALLQALGGDAGGETTLIAADDDIAGNLRAQYPRARIVNLATPSYQPPGQAQSCIFIAAAKQVTPESIQAPAYRGDEVRFFTIERDDHCARLADP